MRALGKGLLTIGLVTGIGFVVAWGAGHSAVVWCGLSGLFWCALLAYGIQWLAAIPAIAGKSEKFFDLTGSITYISVVLFGLWLASTQGQVALRHWLVAGMVIIWALRLGGFLAWRIHKAGKDERFHKIKQSPLRFLGVWTLQGLWVTLTSLAALVILTNQTTTPATMSALGLSFWIGCGLWSIGFALEAIADAQKSKFNAAPANKGRWIDVGLWRYSQHPNYFGEILLWFGVFVSGIEVYKGWQWLAAISPLFVYLLLRYVSGIPTLERRAKTKWGDDPGYTAHCARTSKLIPRPPKALSSN